MAAPTLTRSPTISKPPLTPVRNSYRLHICATCVPVSRGRIAYRSSTDHPVWAITSIPPSARERHVGARVSAGMLRGLREGAAAQAIRSRLLRVISLRFRSGRSVPMSLKPF